MTFLAPTRVVNSMGSARDTFAPFRRTRAGIRPIARDTDEREYSQRTTATNSIEFVVRYRTFYEERMQLDYDGKRYEIEAVQELVDGISPRRMYQIIRAVYLDSPAPLVDLPDNNIPDLSPPLRLGRSVLTQADADGSVTLDAQLAAEIVALSPTQINERVHLFKGGPRGMLRVLYGGEGWLVKDGRIVFPSGARGDDIYLQQYVSGE